MVLGGASAVSANDVLDVFPPLQACRLFYRNRRLVHMQKRKKNLKVFSKQFSPHFSTVEWAFLFSQKKAIVRSLWKELVKTGSRTRLRLLRMTRWEMGAGLAILLFFCFALLGCAWQPCQPITSVTTERHFMVFLTVTAMWKYHICCSAPWVTSWQKSYRKQKMRRNIWSTLSLLCRGESWIWSFFFFLPCVCSLGSLFLFRLIVSLFTCYKNWEGGRKGGRQKKGSFCHLCILSLLILWILPSVPLGCEEKNPDPFSPTQTKKISNLKII